MRHSIQLYNITAGAVTEEMDIYTNMCVFDSDG